MRDSNPQPSGSKPDTLSSPRYGTWLFLLYKTTQKFSKFKVWSVFIILFICGAFVGIGIANWGHSVKTKNIENFDIEVLRQNGLLSKKDKVKILGRGKLNAKINVTAHAFSDTAKKAIEEKGGVVTVI